MSVGDPAVSAPRRALGRAVSEDDLLASSDGGRERRRSSQSRIPVSMARRAGSRPDLLEDGGPGSYSGR